MADIVSRIIDSTAEEKERARQAETERKAKEKAYAESGVTAYSKSRQQGQEQSAFQQQSLQQREQEAGIQPVESWHIDENGMVQDGSLEQLAQKDAQQTAEKYQQDKATLEADNAKISAMPADQQEALVDAAKFYGYTTDWETEDSPRAEIAKQTQWYNSVKALEAAGFTEDEIRSLSQSATRLQSKSNRTQAGEKAAQKATASPMSAITSWLGARIGNIAGGFTGTGEALYQNYLAGRSDARYNLADANASGFMPSITASAVGEAQTGNMGWLGKTVYNVGSSVADNLARLAFASTMGGGAVVSSSLAGLQSFQSTYQSATERGATPEQATTLGMVDAILEIGTEFVSDKIFLESPTAETWKQVFKNAAKNAGTEMLEEEVSYLGNLAADALIMADNSENKQKQRTLMERYGLSESEAKKEVWKEILLQAGQTAIESALSGGIMSGATSTYQMADKSISNAIDSGTEVRTVFEPGVVSQDTTLPNVNEKVSANGGTATNSMADEVRKDNRALKSLQDMYPELGITDEVTADNRRKIKEALRKVYAREPSVVQTAESESHKKEDSVKNALKNALESMQESNGMVTPAMINAVANSKAGIEQLRADTGMDIDGTGKEKKRQIREAMKLLYASIASKNESANSQSESATKNHADSTESANTASPVESNSTSESNVKQQNTRFTLDIPIKTAAKSSESNTTDTITQRTQPQNIKQSVVSQKSATNQNLTNQQNQQNQNLTNQQNQQNQNLTNQRNESERNASAIIAKPTNASDTTNDTTQQNQDHTQTAVPSTLDMQVLPGKQKKKSKTVTNSGANSTLEGVKAANKANVETNGAYGDYSVQHNAEQKRIAQMRTETESARNAEYDNLLKKQNWTAVDSVTAELILDNLWKTGSDKYEALHTAYRNQKTNAGQKIQASQIFMESFRNVSDRITEEIDNLTLKDVNKANFKTEQDFQKWKDETKSLVESIARHVDSIDENASNAKQDILSVIHSLEKIRGTRKGGPMLNALSDRFLNNMTVPDLKEASKRQLYMLPEDMRKHTALQTARSIHFHNVLSALTTDGRNLHSNGIFGAVDIFQESTVGQLFDMWLASKQDNRRTVGNELSPESVKSYFQNGWDAFTAGIACANLDISMVELDTSDAMAQKLGASSFTPNQKGVLGFVNQFMFAVDKYQRIALGATDSFFAQGTRASVETSLNSLNERIQQASGEANLSDYEIAQISEREGLNKTFKDQRTLAKKAKQLQKVVGQDLLMFPEVPSNVISVGTDYLFGVQNLWKFLRVVYGGEQITADEQRKLAVNMGRFVTGKGILAMGMALAAKGMLTHTDDEDDYDKAASDRSQRKNGWWINLFGKNVRLADDPLAASLRVGARLYEAGDAWTAMKSAADESVDYVMDMPVMDTFNDIYKAQSAVKNGTVAQSTAIATMAGDFAAGLFVPACMRNIAYTIDPVYRDTTGITFYQTMLNRVKAQTPGFTDTLPAVYDITGEPQTRFDEGNKIVGAANLNILPYAIQLEKTNDISGYLDELNAKTGSTSIYPNRKAPTSFTYKTADGESKSEMLDTTEKRELYDKTYKASYGALVGQLTQDKYFNSLDTESQLELTQNALAYATQIAKASIASDYTMDKILQENPTMEMLANSMVIKDATATLEKALKANNSEAITTAYASYVKNMTADQKKQLAENATGVVRYFLAAKMEGVRNIDFLKIYAEYKRLDESLASVKEKGTTFKSFVDGMALTQSQKDAINEKMYFRTIIPYEPSVYNKLYEALSDNTKAKDLALSLANIEPLDGQTTVKDWQKFSHIAEQSTMSDNEKWAAMLSVASEAQQKRMNQFRSAGYDMYTYTEIYKSYSSAGSKKTQKIEALRQRGFSQSEAEKLYKMFQQTLS